MTTCVGAGYVEMFTYSDPLTNAHASAQDTHMETTTATRTDQATDQDMLKHYGMASRDSIATDLSITNVEARILAELVGAEESECWSAGVPEMASRLRQLCLKLLAAAARGDAEVVA